MAVVYYKPLEVQQANEADGVPQDYVPTDAVPTIISTFETAVATAAEGDADADADADADSDNI